MKIMRLEPDGPENVFYGAVLNIEYGKFLKNFKSVGRRKNGVYEGTKAEVEKYIAYKNPIIQGGEMSLKGPGHLSKFGIDQWDVTPFCVLLESKNKFPLTYRFRCTRLMKRNCMLNDRVTFTEKSFGVGLRPRMPESDTCRKEKENRLKSINERMKKKKK